MIQGQCTKCPKFERPFEHLVHRPSIRSHVLRARPLPESVRTKGGLMARVVRLLVVLLSVAVLLVTIVRGAGDSSITKAVKAGDHTAVRKLIAARADVNAASSDGSTPLLWAAHKSDLEMARVLITAG